MQQPQAWAHWQARTATYVLPGGESLEQFTHRILTGLISVTRAHKGKEAGAGGARNDPW